MHEMHASKPMLSAERRELESVTGYKGTASVDSTRSYLIGRMPFPARLIFFERDGLQYAMLSMHLTYTTIPCFWTDSLARAT